MTGLVVGLSPLIQFSIDLFSGILHLKYYTGCRMYDMNISYYSIEKQSLAITGKL